MSILIGAIISSLLLILIMPDLFEQFQTAFHGNFRGFLCGLRDLWRKSHLPDNRTHRPWSFDQKKQQKPFAR